MQNITILGSTGSIGANTLDVIAQHPQRFKVFALSAHSSYEALYKQCLRFQPQIAVIVDPKAGIHLQNLLSKAKVNTQVLVGMDALEVIAQHPDVDCVMAAIVGSAGLLPTLAAAKAGKRLLLANKESLVMAGDLFMHAVREHGAVLLPIDSEHNAIFQSMPSGFTPGMRCPGVNRIFLTASGGPFRITALDKLAHVTPEQACAHPNWQMGQKVSIDSATMMNKGLEVIEAHYLFGMPLTDIEVLLHPQSIIHSLVEYADGSVLAQLGNPDMRTPIAHALAWPERVTAGVKPLNLIEIGRLEFEELALDRYPCLRIAYEALSAGGTATTILNAANEVAVQAFLQNNLSFTAIPRLIEWVLSLVPIRPAINLETILEDDAASRELAQTYLQKYKLAV